MDLPIEDYRDKESNLKLINKAMCLTMGFVVHPARAIASPIEGTNIAKMYEIKTRIKVHLIFSSFVILLSPLSQRTSTVSFAGKNRRGIAK